jgi:hypothetical protein
MEDTPQIQEPGYISPYKKKELLEYQPDLGVREVEET